MTSICHFSVEVLCKVENWWVSAKINTWTCVTDRIVLATYLKVWILQCRKCFPDRHWWVFWKECWPRNAKERVDNNADGNDEQVEMVAAPLLQKILLTVHYHRRDLLILVCKQTLGHFELSFWLLWLSLLLSWWYHEYEDASKGGGNRSDEDCPPRIWTKQRNEPT